MKRKSIVKRVSKSLDYVKEYAPSLVMLRAALIPFNDVIVEESAGPQHGCKYDSPADESHFEIVVQDPMYDNGRIVIKFTANLITYESILELDGESVTDGEEPISLDSVFNFLRQLPRQPHAF